MGRWMETERQTNYPLGSPWPWLLIPGPRASFGCWPKRQLVGWISTSGAGASKDRKEAHSNMYTCFYMCTCILIYVHTHIFLFISIKAHTYMHTSMYTYIYIKREYNLCTYIMNHSRWKEGCRGPWLGVLRSLRNLALRKVIKVTKAM